jgi:hypothetical protein
MTMPGRGRYVSLAVTGSVASIAAIALGGLTACEKDQFKGAEAEVGKEKIDPDMPAVPEFKIPDRYPDGSFTVKELRVKGKEFLDQEITVTGYITWIYDCPAQLRGEGKSDAEVQDILENDPMKCRRPQFRIADGADDPEDRTIKVVEVPRPMTAQEKKVYKKVDDTPPDLLRPVPPLAVGDKVIVVGDWRQRALHGDANMNGLLIYKSLTNETQASWSTATATAQPPAETGGKKKKKR